MTGKETAEIPLWQKYTMSVEEVSKYFRIVQTKLRRTAEHLSPVDCTQIHTQNG